jgi:hypothetical protein
MTKKISGRDAFVARHAGRAARRERWKFRPERNTSWPRRAPRALEVPSRTEHKSLTGAGVGCRVLISPLGLIFGLPRHPSSNIHSH